MATPAPKELTKTDESRGIQNATSRFKKQREGQTLQSELLREGERGRVGAANDPDYRTGRPSSRRGGRIRSEFQEAALLRREFEELSRSDDVEYDKGDEALLLKDAPEKPSFPGIIFSIALLKDILDGLEITGIGIIVTTVLSFFLALVLFLWTLGKLSGGWWKKKLIRKIFIKYGLAITVEFIPVLKLIPTATIFVLMAHYDETKLVRLLNGALERMRSGGIKGV